MSCMVKNNIKQKSIAKTLTFWYGLFFILVSSVVLFTIYQTSRHAIQAQEESQLTRGVDAFLSDYKQGRAVTDYENNIYLSVYDEFGVFVQGATPIGLQGVVFEQNRMRSIQTETGTYLYLDRYDDTARFWVRGAIVITNDTQYMETLLWTILIMLPILVIVVLSVGYWLINRIVAPVYKMSQMAKSITTDLDLSKRVSVTGAHNEVSDLGHAFNAMLDAVEYSYDREKQFTADVSHELRTPLSVIVAESEYGKDVSTGETKESFEVIERQAQYMRKTITQLLELERLSSQQAKRFEEFSLSALVQTMGQDVLVMAKESGLSLEWHVSENVDYFGDEHLIGRLLDNLLSNALKYARQKVVVSLDREPAGVVLRVKNDGPKIAAEHVTRIFDRLYQVEDSRSRQFSGNGLGLSYVKSIAVMHGGCVAVSSTSEWTCFEVVL